MKTAHEQEFEDRCLIRGYFSSLIRIADEMRKAGQETLSAKAIFEIARQRHPRSEFNNSHTSAFARRAMEKHPRFRGMFELRAMTSGPASSEEQLALFDAGESSRDWSGEEH